MLQKSLIIHINIGYFKEHVNVYLYFLVKS